jgi:predicted cupin superfamily sugar epimerase
MSGTCTEHIALVLGLAVTLIMNERAESIIQELGLTPHPEGGFFKETFRSELLVKSPVNGEMRNAVTDIYFLLLAGQVSRFHKVLHDEIWHFYEGDPIELIELDADSLDSAHVILGNDSHIPTHKHCVKGGNWQAARSMGDYSLVGCTVAPGFDFADFSFLKENELLSAKLLARNPELADLV